jgi:hypothetical protein
MFGRYAPCKSCFNNIARRRRESQKTTGGATTSQSPDPFKVMCAAGAAGAASAAEAAGTFEEQSSAAFEEQFGEQADLPEGLLALSSWQLESQGSQSCPPPVKLEDEEGVALEEAVAVKEEEDDDAAAVDTPTSEAHEAAQAAALSWTLAALQASMAKVVCISSDISLHLLYLSTLSPLLLLCRFSAAPTPLFRIISASHCFSFAP